MKTKTIKVSKIKPNPNNPRVVDIPGYEGLYFASTNGDIYSCNGRHNKNYKKLRKAIDGCGYEILTLCKDGIRKTKTVHRLVARAFIGLSHLYVNHKNGVKNDNRLLNLEYVSAKQNTIHAVQNGLINFNTIEIAEKKRKKVSQIHPTSKSVVATYISAHEASRVTGFNRGNISTACRTQKIMYNHLWKYED